MSDQESVAGVVVAAEKPCSRCRKVKPLEDFAPVRRGRTGRASQCHECDSERHKERYWSDPAFRAGYLQRVAAYRRSEVGALVTSRAELRCQLRGAVKESTRDRLRQRIAELDGRIAAARAGQGRGQEQDVA